MVSARLLRIALLQDHLLHTLATLIAHLLIGPVTFATFLAEVTEKRLPRQNRSLHLLADPLCPPMKSCVITSAMVPGPPNCTPHWRLPCS